MNTYLDPRHAASLLSSEPLPAWTYRNEELLELEYERVILPSWQFVCHQNSVPATGDYATLDLWRDSIVVLRGHDGRLRAFQNACRHRGSKLVDGNGQCSARLTCPYHAWSYDLDGSLASIPFEASFSRLDRAKLGLRELELEVFQGLVFARLVPGGPSLAELLRDIEPVLAPYRIEDMVPVAGAAITETWDCNWKVALDNYLDNYHVPYGHPGLHRLMDNDLGCTINGHGVSFSASRIRERASSRWSERLYQEMARTAYADLPESVRSTWLFCFMPANIGFDVFPDSFDIFQVLPRGIGSTEIRVPLFERPDTRREARAARYLCDRINAGIGAEDRVLCERVQAGLCSQGYAPGPLSDFEMPIRDMHMRLRSACPVVTLPQAPTAGTLRHRNEAMLNAPAA
jgi:phenylpropionate dioxygenase-like ring-hydroxylating dioxygenase large terminal subunit